MTVVLVGLGSIGARHAEVLRELGERVLTVSRRAGHGDYGTVTEAVGSHPEALLVIATETADHMATLSAAIDAGRKGAVVVEKPLAASSEEARALASAGPVWVAYNLRFSPVVQALRHALAEGGEPALSVRMHVGQDLTTWRPGTEAKSSYSAHAGRGGGVLRDLSHDLDLLIWLFGPVTGLCALGGRKGDVTVDSDDCWNLLLRTRGMTDVSLSLNYLDRPAVRYIHVTTATRTLLADLIGGTLSVNGATTAFAVDRNGSYRDMWRELLASGRDDGPTTCCTWDEALGVLDLIEACERSARGPIWLDL